MSRFLYLKEGELPEAPTVAQLHRYISPVFINDKCLDVLDLFLNDPTLYALPVIDADHVPITLIERHFFVELFSRRYIREVHGKKSIAQLMESIPMMDGSPIIVDAATSVDDVANIIIDNGMQHMVRGFIVTDKQRYCGIANGHDLLNEITQRKQSELYYLAHYDSLTGLPNRMLFTDRLNQACREASRKGRLVGLMFVDLDRFKQVNDSLGHGVGDLLLRAVAERLQQCARDCDTVARLGGDEFAVLMDGVSGIHDVDSVAQRIVDCMQQSFALNEHQVFITASIGVALYPKDDTDIGNLLAKADAAMYDSKSNGRNGYRNYVPGLSMYSFDHMSLETGLRSALDNHELLLFYQPQINLITNQVVGAEALIRWQHPVRGLLSPAQFIQIAEDSGLIVSIGSWVIREACRQLSAWKAEGLPCLRMSINVSALQFRQESFCDVLKNILDETQVDPGHIELELTESIVMHHAANVLDTLIEIKNTGVLLAIDDFGTGYSSLSYLRRFPIDRLKIDQSFIREIQNMPVNESIVRAIAALAKSLSLGIVAEGTETEAELAILKACACDEAQGYHFLPPVSAADFIAWVSKHNRQ